MQTPRQELVAEVVSLIERMMRRVRHPLPPRWVEQDLTLPQLRALMLLSRGPRRMGEVAGHLGVSLPTATDLVDRLVAKGLVERRQGSRDRRVVECLLTPRGRELVEESLALRRSLMSAVLGRLSDEELRTVASAVRALIRAMESCPGEAGREEAGR